MFRGEVYLGESGGVYGFDEVLLLDCMFFCFLVCAIFRDFRVMIFKFEWIC